MKKLIAISVVFALVAGAVFAVDVAGSVVGVVDVIKSDTGKDSKVKSGGKMGLIRLDGAGENDDGTFGGYIRAQEGDGNPDNIVFDAAYAWWKPVDQFKLIVGRQSDAFWGKEGVTGWMFNQKANDGDFATNYGIWYGNGWASGFFAGGAVMCNRYTFYEGWADWGAGMEITPTDMVGINIAIPFIAGSGLDENNMAGDKKPADQAAYVFRAAQFQLDLKFDFGNIAISYDGGYRNATGVGSAGGIYVYAGLNVIENLGIDVGFSYHLTGDAKLGQEEKGLPIGVGLGLKYAADSFGVKFRTTVALAGDKNNTTYGDATYINTSVLPYFTLSDSLAAFVNVGLGMFMPSHGDNVMGWYFNPYLRAGAEWGPSFYAGVKVETSGAKNAAGDKVINWSVPVALNVSF